MKKIFLFTILIFFTPCIAFAGNISYYVYDNSNRSVTSLIDTSGAVVNKYTYDAFGNISSSQENVSNNFNYTGEQFDKETSLLFLRKRYYDPAIGRFITKDPHPGLRITPQTKNPYPYCSNNPVNFTDPNGDLALQILGGLLGAGISGFLEAMNPNSNWQSITAAAIMGGIGGVVTTTWPSPASWGGIAALRNIVTSIARGDEPTISGATQSAILGIAGGYLGQGIGWLSDSDALGKLVGANAALWLGAAFSDFNYQSEKTQPAYNPNLPDIGATNRLQGGWPDTPTSFNLASATGGGGLFDLGGNIFADPAIFGGNYGGVSLSKTASLLTDVTEITGAFYDDKTGQIILVGKENVSLPQMKLDDLAVAVNSVYSGQDPGVSIDPPLVNNQFSVRYDGRTSDTEFGYIMFESDRIMKTLSLGKDNISGQAVSSNVTGYKNLLDRYRNSNLLPEGEGSYRFWFKPKEMKLVKSQDGSSFVFDTATMEVLTESKHQNNVVGDPDAEAFAANLTQYFNDYAQERPIFKDLERLGKVTSIVKWIKDNEVPIDLSFINNYQVPAYSTPSTTPATTVSTEWQEDNTIYTLSITGGVTYTKPNEYLADSSTNPVADPLKQAAISQRPAETNFKWNFSSAQNEALTAVAESFARLRKDGNLKFSSTDLSYPADCDFPLEFRRFYDSFYDKESGFGYGWEYRPYQIRFPEKKQSFTFGGNNLILNLYAQVFLVDRITGEEDLYELLGIDSANLPLYAKTGEAHTLREISDGSWELKKTDNTKIVFDTQGNLLSTIDKNAKSISYVYQDNRLISIDAGGSGAINISYSGNNIVSVTGSGPKAISYAYDTSGNLISVTNAENQSTSFTYDTDHRITLIKDAKNNVVFEGTYDDYNRLVTSKINNELDFSRNFNLNQRKTIETDPNTNKVTKLYDDKYRVTEQLDHLGNQVNIGYSGDYGPGTVTDAKGASTTYTYDVHGNVSSVTNPDGSKVQLYYDQKDNLIAIRDANGIDTAYGYDNNNRLEKIYHQVVLNFDANGNLTGWQYEPNNITTFTYDTVTGHLLSITNAESREQIFKNYNSAGLPQIIKTSGGLSLTNLYDSLFRLKGINDPAGNSISFEYTNTDQIKSITTSTGTVYCGYDQNNNLSSLTDAKGNETKFNYDTKNNLESVTDPELGSAAYTYDKFNNLNGADLPNGTKFGYEFDDLNRLVLAKSGMGIPTPVIAVLEDSLDLGTVVLGSSVTKELTVYNIGTKELTVTNVSCDNSLFSLDTNSTIIPAGDSFIFHITLVPQTELEISAILTINSEDSETPELKINLYAKVTLPSVRPIANSAEKGIQVRWQYSSDPTGNFDHYAVYRSSMPITNLSGLTPIVTITDRFTTTYNDTTAVLGQNYYYTVVAFDRNGYLLSAVESYGPVSFLDLGRLGGALSIDSSYKESGSALAYNSSQKEYLLVFETNSSNSTSYDIFGQRISQDGEKIGSTFPIFDTSYSEHKPQLAYNSINNEYMVVAQADLSGNGTRYHAVGQRLSGTGAKLSSWFYLLETTGQERKPRVTYNPIDSRYAVVMEYDRNGDGARQDIIRCLLSDAGSLISYNGFSSSDSNIQFYAPNVIHNSLRNEYLDVFEVAQISEGKNDIYGYRIDASNTAVGNLLQLSFTGRKNYLSKLAFNPDRIPADGGEYVCIWHYDINNDGKTFSLALARLKGTGSFNVLKTYGISNKSVTSPEICYYKGQNEYFVSFTTNKTDTTDSNVDAQRMSATDMSFITPLDKLIPIASSSSVERNNCLAYNPDKKEFLSAYEFEASENNSNPDIKAQRIGTPTLALSVNPSSLDFGATDTIKSFQVINAGGAPMLLSSYSNQSWLSVTPSEVSTAAAVADFIASISRSGFAAANYSGNISIDYGTGQLNIPVSMTVIAHPPELPSNPSPSDGATNQADLGSPLTVSLNWECADLDIGDSLTYDIYFSDDYNKVNNRDPSYLVSSNQTQASYKSDTLQYLKTYYWRVVAKDSYGLITASPVWNFITANIPAPQIIPYSPDPTNNKRPTFSWNSVYNAVKYHLQISTDSSFSSFIVDNANLTGISYTLTPDLFDGKIYWRVSSIDGLGNESIFSETDDFTVKTSAPLVPTIIPYSPDPTKEQKPTLSWQKVSEAVSYNIQISSSVDFSNLIADKYLTTTYYTPDRDLPEGMIYWRVSSKDLSGNESEFSTVNEFRIDITSPPKISGLKAAPAKNKITLTWDTFNNIDGDFKLFNIYRSGSAINNVSDMFPIAEAITDSSVTTFNVTSVTEGDTYYYAVTAEDILGNENKSVTAVGPVKAENQPPELNTIGDKVVNECQLLEFTVSATDPDNDNLTYTISNLPRGAYFNSTNGLFSWLPNYDQQGTYAVRFEVSDGTLTSYEDISIMVNDVVINPVSGERAGIRIKIRVIP